MKPEDEPSFLKCLEEAKEALIGFEQANAENNQLRILETWISLNRGARMLSGFQGEVGATVDNELEELGAQNIKTALTLGQVRGATLIAIASQDRPLFEYSPLEIKKAVTGYGQADKNQVSMMIKTLLNITDDKMDTDASDALGAAFCHLNSRLFQQKIEEST